MTSPLPIESWLDSSAWKAFQTLPQGYTISGDNVVARFCSAMLGRGSLVEGGVESGGLEVLGLFEEALTNDV